jgi:AcrR family transcriptional regulator
MPASRKRGRRRKSDGDTRAAIIRAAKESFAHAGPRAPSLRTIAERAGVDQALIFYYFGSKEKLFYEMGSEGLKNFLDLGSLGAPTSPRFGTALVKAFLEQCESSSSGMSFEAFFQGAIAGSHLRPLLTQLWSEDAPLRLRGHAHGGQDDLVTGLIVSQLLGLGIARYHLKLEPLASASIERVAEAYGPALTRLLSRAR